MHEQQLKEMKCTETIWALEVYKNPNLVWDQQFKEMKTKLTQSITKLMKMNMKSYQTYMYFNMHVIGLNQQINVRIKKDT